MRRLSLRAASAVVVGILVGLVTAVVVVTPADAHAYLVTSAPADGSVLDRAPEKLTLSFTENVELSATTVDIVDGDGRHWASTSMVLRPIGQAEAGTSVVADTELPVEVVVGLPVLPINTYHVAWSTLSSDDLHVTSGKIVFGVQREVGGGKAIAGPAGPGAREALLRWIGLAGFCVLFGGAALAMMNEALCRERGRRGPNGHSGQTGRGRWSIQDGLSEQSGQLRRAWLRARAWFRGRRTVRSGASGSTSDRDSHHDREPDPDLGAKLDAERRAARHLSHRLLRVAAIGGVVALIAVPTQLFVQVSAGGSTWRRLFMEQAISARWLLREIGVALLLGSVLWAGYRLRSRRGLSTAIASVATAGGAAGAAMAAVGTAWLGHLNGTVGTTIAMGTVHVLAAGGWAGSVIAAGVALVPVLRGEPAAAQQVRSLLRSFTVLAIACVSVLVLSGLMLTSRDVSTVDSLLLSPYGWLLLAKVGAVIAAGVIGVRTSRRLHTMNGAISVRSLVGEAVLLVGVLALAGSLAAAGPARGPKFPVASGIATVPEVSGQAADIVDALTVRPNRPGPNIISIAVNDTRRPAPAPVTGVSVSLSGPDGTQRVHPVTRGVDGWTVSVDDIRTPGAWRIGVTVMRDGLSPVTDTHAWVVAPTEAQTTPVVSAAPLSPTLDLTAKLLAPTLLLAALWHLRRRLRPRKGLADHEP